MRGFKLNPNTQRKLQRFRSIKRGYYSFLALVFLVALALLGPWLVNNRALVVRYEGHLYFPTLGAILPGTTFGLGYEYETDYRTLQKRFADEKSTGLAKGNWVLMPPIPFNGTEVCEVYGTLEQRDGAYLLDGVPYADGQALRRDDEGRLLPVGRILNGKLQGGEAPKGSPLLCFLPYPNSPGVSGHILGTDESGHDILARLFYGFRILCAASAIYLGLTYLIGIIIGCAMGYFGGWFDICTQRLIEIWANIPHLYLIIFLSSLLIPSLFWLMLIIVAFSWITLTYYTRTGTYREKGRDYVAAARLLGASNTRIIFRHILPNTLSTVITFVPFMVAAVVFQLTALDFLGFGLPPTEPTWGEILRQGTENFDSPWILSSVVACLVIVLVLTTFVGEAIREAFDPKKFTTYQ
ncbi:MAG: ABC transporter permease subunit [Puniceicoccales bacterium]|jgi:microcin C transport system permease protein|nr:ABC transporter permease subunit [Puniceicoccales bacterium]